MSNTAAKHSRANTIYLQSGRRESLPRSFGTRVTPQRERKYNSANYACHRKPLSAARICEIVSPPSLQKYIATRKIQRRRHLARSPTKVSGFVNYELWLGKPQEKGGRDITAITSPHRRRRRCDWILNIVCVSLGVAWHKQFWRMGLRILIENTKLSLHCRGYCEKYLRDSISRFSQINDKY